MLCQLFERVSQNNVYPMGIPPGSNRSQLSMLRIVFTIHGHDTDMVQDM